VSGLEKSLRLARLLQHGRRAREQGAPVLVDDQAPTDAVEQLDSNCSFQLLERVARS